MRASGEFLIDTNALIKLMARDPSLRWRIGHNFRCFLSFISIGELYAGAHQSSRRASNLGEIQRICQEMPILPWDLEIADHYGRIHALLRAKGKPIPQNDVWIAATAMRHGLALITLDQHFSFIDGLPTEIW
ncbi:MAG TPA: type II toxin-antitoxin system VapC family toxin [Candidatus Acidoferrales bacterium]|nr:type II toxin-antitoxin system VapC family toxin [Candidatus Acidoferrales bacterium]